MSCRPATPRPLRAMPRRTAELEAASVASILTAIYGALKRLEMIPGSDLNQAGNEEASLA
jgi:hypothetical protein